MLLAEKTNTVEDLTRARAGGVETLFQIRVLPLQPLDTLRVDPRSARRRLELLHPGFGLKCTTSERRELVAQVTDELLELLECLELRTFAV